MPGSEQESSHRKRDGIRPAVWLSAGGLVLAGVLAVGVAPRLMAPEVSPPAETEGDTTRSGSSARESQSAPKSESRARLRRASNPAPSAKESSRLRVVQRPAQAGTPPARYIPSERPVVSESSGDASSPRRVIRVDAGRGARPADVGELPAPATGKDGADLPEELEESQALESEAQAPEASSGRAFLTREDLAFELQALRPGEGETPSDFALRAEYEIDRLLDEVDPQVAAELAGQLVRSCEAGGCSYSMQAPE